MSINKHNYEAFFLDYHEGNLTPQQVAELLLFVEQHPELKEAFESFENCTLEDLSTYVFEGKEDLKKELSPALSQGEGEHLRIHANNCEEYMIRAIENDLGQNDLDLLENFLKINPQYITEFSRFQRTKLQPEPGIIFQGKEELKHIHVEREDLLIASIEGSITLAEKNILQKELAVDNELRSTLAAYQRTKLIADASVVFEDKASLKREEKRIIPLYYYVAAAAAVLLLFGMFSYFSSKPAEKDYAHTKELQLPPAQENTTNDHKNIRPVKEKDMVSPVDHTGAVYAHASANKSLEKNPVVQNGSNDLKKDSVIVPPALNQAPEINIAQTTDKKEEQINNISPVLIETPSAGNAVAMQKENNKAEDPAYMTLAQVAVSKIKEKTLDPESLAAEQKSGRIRRLSGWDALRVLAKGVSKVTGTDVEVKETYNDAGEVTAYAFNAGKIGFSKGR